MRLISLNLGKREPIQHAKPSGATGIFKKPYASLVDVTTLGLVGDTIVDTENHGGYDQAVYVYGTVDYDWWSAELGHVLEPGTFGENLTVSELESAPWRIGDRLRIGPVLLEVTSPRIPCITLSARMGDPRFLRRFVLANRPGVYCRVIETGAIQVGAEVVLEPYPGEPYTIAEMFRNTYTKADEDTLRRALSTPLHRGARFHYENRLAELEFNPEDR
jgi:MOSC domain-containing protein YiiM